MKWEYKVYPLPTGIIIENELNTKGLNRWELVTTHMHYGHIVVYLKRQKL